MSSKGNLPRKVIVKKRYKPHSTQSYNSQRENDTKREYIVECPKNNPDDMEVVTRCQSRIRYAQAHEKSLINKLFVWWKEILGVPPSVREATPILEHILLGSKENAYSRLQLVAAGVTHICNCALQVANRFEGEYVYMKINILDASDVEIMPYFQVVANFFKRVEEVHGRVLVHCISGISRSATFVIAYLMIAKRMRLADAYKLVRSKRSCVQPNQSFRLQLAKYEVRLE